MAGRADMAAERSVRRVSKAKLGPSISYMEGPSPILPQRPQFIRQRHASRYIIDGVVTVAVVPREQVGVPPAAETTALYRRLLGER